MLLPEKLTFFSLTNTGSLIFQLLWDDSWLLLAALGSISLQIGNNFMAETQENLQVLAHILVAPHCTLCSLPWTTWCSPLSGFTSAFACALLLSQSLHPSFYTSHCFLWGPDDSLLSPEPASGQPGEELEHHMLRYLSPSGQIWHTTLFWSEAPLALCHPVRMGTGIKRTEDTHLLKSKEFCNIANKARGSPPKFFLCWCGRDPPSSLRSQKVLY